MVEDKLQVPSLQGFTIRPPKMEDTEIAAELHNICALEITGKKHYTTEDFVRTWQAPKYKIEEAIRLVFTPGGKLAAYVEVGGHQEPHVQIGVGVQVHPDFRTRGIGAALMAWGEARAREILRKAPQEAQVIMTAACNLKDEYRLKLYQRYGMEPMRHFFSMEIEFDTPPQAPEIPEGILIRPYDEATEVEKISQAYLDSFVDYFGFSGQSLEDTVTYVRHLIKNDPTYDPNLWLVAVAAEEIVGFSFCGGEMTEDPDKGHVNVFGVVRGWRKRGLGMALLKHSFVELHRQGSQRVSLTVDASNLTGATRLYEKAGMSIKERYDLYRKVLREGEVLIRQ